MELRHFMESMGITPKGVYFFTKKGCERVSSKEMQSLSIKAEKGLCVFSSSRPTAAFLPVLRPFVRGSARLKEVDRELLEHLSSGKKLKLEWQDGFYILSYKKVPYFLVEVKNAHCRVVGR